MGNGIGKIIAFLVVVIVSPLVVHPEVPDTAAGELPTIALAADTTAWEIPTTAPTTPTQTQHTQSVETAPQSVEPTTESVLSDYSRGFVHYRVNGVTPPYEWEWFLFCKLEQFGIGWYYPTAVCQIYQESNWNQYSTNGRDHGICQQKGIYWDGRAAQAGIPGADIWDVEAQIHVYAWQMSQYLAEAGGDVNRALSMYYLGYDGWSDEYIGHVMRWVDYLEVVP